MIGREEKNKDTAELANERTPVGIVSGSLLGLDEPTLGSMKSPIWTNVPEDTGPPPFPVNTEPHGATYDMVMSEKSGENPTPQDPHWTGQLLPPAIPRPDHRVAEFFDGSNVLG